MQTATRGSLRAIAGQLAVIAGVFHLGLGMYYTVGGPGAVAGDLRVLLWAAAGAALVGGVAVGALGWRRPVLYRLGAALVATLVAAHLLWPVVTGAGFYLGPVPDRGAGPVGYLTAQVVAAPAVAKVAVGVELALLALLLVLWGDGGKP